MENKTYCNGCNHPPNAPLPVATKKPPKLPTMISLSRKLPIMSDSIPERVLKIPITVEPDSVYKDGLQIVVKIRPEWITTTDQISKGEEDGDNVNHIQMKVFSGGITNKLVGFYATDDEDDVVIVKIYGEKTEEFIDREKEISTMEVNLVFNIHRFNFENLHCCFQKFLHANKFGSKLFAVFNNGIAYEYFPGEVLTVDNCRDPGIYPLVAKTIANLHSIPVFKESQNEGTVIWQMLLQFNQMSLESLEHRPDVAKRLEAVGFAKDWCLEQINLMKSLLDDEPDMPLGFCHNDILLGNVIYNEAKQKISLIDFEYGAVNYVPFDIANHFNEYSGVDDLDYSRCPNQSFIRTWVQEYLKHYKCPSDFDTNENSQFTLDKFVRWVNLCIPLSHLLWTVWASIQACHSTIDFDFVNYCNLRIPEYYKSLEYFRQLEETQYGVTHERNVIT